MRAIGYVRVSTAEQATEGISLAAQRAILEREASARGWALEVLADEGVSAKDLRRPQLQGALERLQRREADVLLAVRLDRISRDVHDFTGLLRRSQREGWQLVCLDPDVDTSTAFGGALVQMIAVMAELERRLIGQRTREALAHAKANGAVLGHHVKHSEDTLRLILDARAAGQSLQSVANDLNDAGVPTSNGSRWYPATVKRAEQSLRAQALA